MRTTIVTCSTVIALGLAFGAAAAEQTLKSIQAYRLGNDDQRAVLYYTESGYTESGNGYEVVTTWIDDQDVQMRHIGHLEPGQRYTLSLTGLSPPVQFTIRSDAGQVVMDVPESSKYARQCSGLEASHPTPLQRLVLCPREHMVASHSAPSVDIESTQIGNQ